MKDVKREVKKEGYEKPILAKDGHLKDLTAAVTGVSCNKKNKSKKK